MSRQDYDVTDLVDDEEENECELELESYISR